VRNTPCSPGKKLFKDSTVCLLIEELRTIIVRVIIERYLLIPLIFFCKFGVEEWQVLYYLSYISNPVVL
jgi:hypothetical protein